MKSAQFAKNETSLSRDSDRLFYKKKLNEIKTEGWGTLNHKNELNKFV